MTKYSITRTPSPAYEQAYSTPGLHVHVDASGKYSTPQIGALVERRHSEEQQTELVVEKAHELDVDEIAVAEAVAVRYGAQLGTELSTADEHLFLYTDSDAVFAALYGQRSKSSQILRSHADATMEWLSDPTTYTIILCDGEVNPAHETSRQEVYTAE